MQIYFHSGRALKEKDDSRPDPLRDPRALDESMAGVDNETDPSITAIDPERGEGDADADLSRPASPTSPPSASQSRSHSRASQGSQAQGNLADHLVAMVARGEDMPGTHDEDALVEGDEEKERDLDSVAVAEQAARATRTRQKQKATQKNRSRYLLRKLTPIPTVTCLTRSVSLNRAEKDRAEKDRAAKDVSRAAKDVSRWAAKDRSVKERGRERRWIWFRMMTSRIRKKALGIRQLLCRRSTRIGRALSWTMSAAAS